MEKKVLIIANYAAFYSGNFIESLNVLEDTLLLNGYIVEYVFPKETPFFNWDDGDYLKKHKVYTSSFSPYKLAKNIKKIVSDRQMILHMHFLDMQQILAIKFMMLHSDCKFICHEHMRIEKERKRSKRLKTYFGRVACRYLLRDWSFVAVSNAVYSDLIAIMKKDNNIYLVKNAISTKRLDKKSSLEENNIILDKSRDVVVFGTHFRRKGVDIAFKAIQKNRHHLRLIILTHDIKQAQNKLNSIANNWQDFAIIYHVVQDVQYVYNQCLCFISPSRSEAFGYAVAEASYCYTQVVASDVPGQNSLRDIPGIIWVEPESVDKLSEALDICWQRYNDQRESLEREKIKQRAYIKVNYNLRVWCSDIISIYNNMEKSKNT